MILFSLGKQKPEMMKSMRQVISNEELDRWRSVPRSFLELEADLSSFLDEISRMARISYKIVVKRKMSLQNEWFHSLELTELRMKIKIAIGKEKTKLQNKYINECR